MRFVINESFERYNLEHACYTDEETKNILYAFSMIGEGGPIQWCVRNKAYTCSKATLELAYNLLDARYKMDRFREVCEAEHGEIAVFNANPTANVTTISGIFDFIYSMNSAFPETCAKIGVLDNSAIKAMKQD